MGGAARTGRVRHGDGVVRLASVVLGLGLPGLLAVAALEAHLDHVSSRTIILGLASVLAGLAVAPAGGGKSVSASFLVVLLAAALLGPASACGCALISELIAAWRLRTPRYAVAFNALGMLAPALAASNLIRVQGTAVTNSLGSYLLVAAAGVVCVLLNYAIVATYQNLYWPEREFNLRVLWEFAPGLGLSIMLAVAGVAITVKLGNAGLAFGLSTVLTFSYMAHLLDRARRRAEQYVSLSWGVLAGLIRALDVRDRRAARHAAAVAGFARDIAGRVGMSEQDRELSHTAGLLHDIGHFALSDRVAERGRSLTEPDWVAIRRHPELGAEILRDLGMYGPVAEIVLAHHERIDGRGYPRGITGDEIPEIAKIVAVAEVYDTLTASDTYRTRMGSFEAMYELRRVASSQLDGRYVEALATLLGGEGVEYRHADSADFDAELDMDRRIKEARTGSSLLVASDGPRELLTSLRSRGVGVGGGLMRRLTRRLP
jgi:putative nucleotidyltransferase with HDIG domain